MGLQRVGTYSFDRSSKIVSCRRGLNYTSDFAVYESMLRGIEEEKNRHRKRAVFVVTVVLGGEDA